MFSKKRWLMAALILTIVALSCLVVRLANERWVEEKRAEDRVKIIKGADGFPYAKYSEPREFMLVGQSYSDTGDKNASGLTLLIGVPKETPTVSVNQVIILDGCHATYSQRVNGEEKLFCMARHLNTESKRGFGEIWITVKK